jgi:hypothetical protein
MGEADAGVAPRLPVVVGVKNAVNRTSQDLSLAGGHAGDAMSVQGMPGNGSAVSLSSGDDEGCG